jgi:hypothetical protein
MILRIQSAELRGPHRLWLEFSDGSRAEVDVLPLLSGPIFEPLRDPAYFAQVSLDTICGTVVWPNGADLAPEALRALVAVQSPIETVPQSGAAIPIVKNSKPMEPAPTTGR